MEYTSYKILAVSKIQLAPYGEIFLVEATTDSKKNSFNTIAKLFSARDDVTDEFRLATDSPLIEEILHVYENHFPWYADMSKFQTKEGLQDVNGRLGIRTIHEEIVEIDLEAMIKKAIRKSVLAQMGFAGLDELKTYTAKVTTMKNGYVYANHDLDNLVAEDDDDAYKMMLSAVSQREGRIVYSSDILSCVILPKDEKLFDFET